MTNTMDKFNNYLLEYYKEILSELNFLGILKNFTSSMDIKKLYPLLDYPENNKYFESDFRNLIIEGKNLTEKDYYEFSLYDSIISTILNSSIFENVDKRYYELSDLKEDFDNGSLDYSFITKFMMKHKFSISEINIVLSNYKPNKRKPVENNFDASLSKVELPKRDNKVKDNFLHNEKYISIIAFLKSNELLYKDYLNNEAVVSILSLAKPYLDFDNAMYPEVNFITLLTVLQTLERKLDIMINSNISSDEDITKLLDSMFDIYEECKKIIPKENVFDMPNEVINLTDINISPEDNDENILETAAMSDRIDLAELLIKKKAVVTPIALINAVDTGNIKLVKLLLSNGGEVNKIGKYSDGEKMTSALYEAITLGDFPMVKFLIKEGAGDTDIKEAVTDSNSYRIKKYIYQKFPGLQDD